MNQSLTLDRPTSEAEVVDIVNDARRARTPLAIEGGATRAGLGRPVRAPRKLSTAALTGITLYEPGEMVISARAGTPLAEIESVLAEKGQMLPFEPMDHRAIYGATGEPSIGAVAACNLSGPRRIQGGAARDHLLGLRLVNGRGEAVKSGGRVMKNVTGLDLVKVMCGSFGTLGILTEVTFKVLPRPRRTATLVIEGLEDAQAIACLSAALGSPYEVSGAAHLPACLSPVPQTLLRIEHFPESVDYRMRELEKLLASYGPMHRLDHDASLKIWREIGDVTPLAKPSDQSVWRISTAPTRAPLVMAAISAGLKGQWFYDWGGGLIWFATTAGGDCGAAIVRAAVQSGHATLIRAPQSVREDVPVFAPPAAPLMQLTRGIKDSFDPHRLFNPGRMYAGL
jgi:glycolate oxidase FAD binding subunit